MKIQHKLLSAAVLAAAVIGSSAPALAAGLSPLGQVAAAPAAVRSGTAPVEPRNDNSIGGAAPAASDPQPAKVQAAAASSSYALHAALFRAPSAPSAAQYPR